MWASGHLHALHVHGFRPPVCWFVTLTYRGVHDWRAEHLTKAVQGFRNWCAANGVECRYTWVAELQARGAVHYHLLAWLPVSVRMPKWDVAPTARRRMFWPHGMTNTQVAKAGIGYLMKYLSKLGTLSRFPKGLRLYGMGGLSRQARATRSWFNLPTWAKRVYGVGELVRRPGGLVVSATGEILPRAWRLQRTPLGPKLVKVREVPSRFDESMLPPGEYLGAYSSFPRETVA